MAGGHLLFQALAIAIYYIFVIRSYLLFWCLYKVLSMRKLLLLPNYGWFSLGWAGNSVTKVVQPTFDVTSPPSLRPQTRAPVVHSPSLVMKTAITKLQEYCQQNDVNLPDYKDSQVTGGFRCIVTVRGKQYSGETKSKKQDARHSAAEVALQKLNSSSKLSYMRIVIAT